MLEVFGLAYLSDLDAAERRESAAVELKLLAQDALLDTKRKRVIEREQFRQAMNIRGIAMQQFYRLRVEKAEPCPEFTASISRFRIMLRPMDYFVEFATMEPPALYNIPAYRRCLAEDTAARFACYIREHMPAEIAKQLEGQL